MVNQDGAAAPAVRVSKLGYVGFVTPDLDRLVEYYTQVLGFSLVDFSPQGAFVTTGTDHHCVVLTPGEAHARSVVGYEVFEDLADAQRRLSDLGYPVQRRTDIGPGTPDVLVLTEPETGVELHLMTSQDPSGAEGTAPLRPTKLGHVAAFTPDLAPTQAFYQDVLGFKWSDTVGDFFVFLRCNADHHAANFMASRKRTGMHHVAYEMRDPNHLITVLDHLAKHGYRLHWGPGRHGPGHNLFTYHKDPDGNTIELFTQIDQVVDEAKGYWEPRPWHETYPMGPRTWEVDIATVNQWGIVNEQELDH
ncbi:VOC family protein [Amycolatopsis sp. WQ 127309]|uniref:VOC family protein n=1 Tax=Amycolatopsis sp. WQ 127309 TaxID=2932773 RepID=UPI001FF2BF2B|nr:VOC family protein [Amycolatopsis sp. WQ 127309]UOZ06922.1 VOC family protein [Amycolatopsis sp. WQ 127309]